MHTRRTQNEIPNKFSINTFCSNLENQRRISQVIIHNKQNIMKTTQNIKREIIDQKKQIDWSIGLHGLSND